MQNPLVVVTDIVAQFLEFEDWKSFRLICRAISQELTGRRFYQSLRRQTTTLEHGSLVSLEALSQHDTLSGCIQHIRIMAEVHAILSAKHVQMEERRWPAEKKVQCYGEEAFLQLDAVGRPATKEERDQIEADLAWMQHHRKDTDSRKNGSIITPSEAEIVERLAAILSHGRRRGTLTTVELDARFIDGPGKRYSSPLARHIVPEDRQALWVRASQIYRLSIAAIALSGVAIPDLRLYSNTMGCGVPSYDVTVGLVDIIGAGFSGVGSSVREFAMTYSTRIDHGWEGWVKALGSKIGKAEKIRQRRQWQQIWDEIDEYVSADDGDDSDVESDSVEVGGDSYDDDEPIEEKGSEIVGRYGDNTPQAFCKDNFLGISGIITLMPNLELLDLHMYQTLEYESYWGGSRLNRYDRVFGTLAEQQMRLQSLKRLVLRGHYIRGEHLVQFMENHPQIEVLELRTAFLTRRVPLIEWKEVLEQIRIMMSQGRHSLNRLLLSDLYQPTLGMKPYAVYASHPLNMLRVGEEKQNDRDGWWSGIACKCGLVDRIHTREFDRWEMSRRECFDFITMTRQCNCGLQERQTRASLEMRTIRRDVCGGTYGS